MHDPYTLVLGTRYLSIWHRDRGGSDGACGWSFPRPNEQQLKRLKNLAWHESHYPYFLRYATKQNMNDPTDTETLYRSVVLMVADALSVRMSFDEAARFASTRCHIGGVDGVERMFCFQPGWHSNYQEDRRESREEYWMGTLSGVARQILRERRPWHRHPRWHFWHWRITARVFGFSLGSKLP